METAAALITVSINSDMTNVSPSKSNDSYKNGNMYSFKVTTSVFIILFHHNTHMHTLQR